MHLYAFLQSTVIYIKKSRKRSGRATVATANVKTSSFFTNNLQHMSTTSGCCCCRQFLCWNCTSSLVYEHVCTGAMCCCMWHECNKCMSAHELCGSECVVAEINYTLRFHILLQSFFFFSYCKNVLKYFHSLLLYF